MTYEEAYKGYLIDLRDVAQTPEGSRVLCWLLEQSGAFEPVWSPKNAQLARAAVLKDFGQEILDDLAMAADGVHDSIQRTMRIRRKSEDTLNIFSKGETR